MAASRRWPAFSLSLTLHVGAIALLTWIDIAFAPPALPHYVVTDVPERRPDDSTIIWYDFHKAVPEVTPDQPFGPSPTPHGEIDPSQTLVTLSPDAPSTRQVIRQPDHPELVPEDTPAPNMVAVAVKPPPKVFVPPSPPKQAQKVAIRPVDAPPALDIAQDTAKTPIANALGAMTSLQKLPPKAFVPPPARSGATKAPQIALPVPDSQATSTQPLEAVIVGLNPGTALPPPGSRAAQIARAPEAGTPSSGAPLPSGAVVPGLLSHGKPGDVPAPAPSPAPPAPDQRPRQEIVLPGVNRMMSAPLRPSARVIPATVEARFTYRNVYTLVIPGPAMPGYGGDWVMWFAEHDPPEISSGPRILAPIPSRKSSPATVDADATALPPSATFQFGASIDKAGNVASAVILRGPADPALRRRVTDELASWEFKPALHDGEPMAVDVVLEIPFRWQAAAPTGR